MESLRQAGSQLATNLRPIKTTSLVGSPGAAAAISGAVSSLGQISTLAATREVNEQTATVRRSSTALGLDITSPEAPSRLNSTSGLGLDVASPERPSLLDSSGVLGLDVTSPQAVSTITSTAEANTALTSYGVVQATFTKGANTQTSLGNISGVYTGTGLAAGATSLQLQITSNNSTMGSTPVLVNISVSDQNNLLLGNYVGTVAAGQNISLGANTGLSIAFTSGSLLKNAQTTFNVSNTTPTNVDPTAVFNNSNVNLRPRFENNGQVVAGAFTVNGTSVSVLANDTINSVLSRLNSTVAGISASFSGDKVTLQTTANSEDSIVLANDTSGFLARLKLTSATTVKGNLRDDQQVLSKTSQFASVSNGSFTVNGVAISVNKATDSLQSILSRINSSGAGVSAAYSAVADKITLTTLANTEDNVAVANDTTGFLVAARLSTNNTVKGNLRDDQQFLTKTTQFSSVAGGSFTINGVAITVNPASDTLQTLLARINASAAGVSASYDSSTDKLSLVTTANSEEEVMVSNDTTGFLSAAHLNGAATVRGNLRDDQQVLSKTTQFSSVASGALSINGVSVALNVATDSFQSVLSRINSAGTGVTASHDPAADKLVLTPNTPGATLVLDEGGTGFLSAARVPLAALGTRVNPDAAFNGLRFASPLFDDGMTVSAGAFLINGVTISVAADDTVKGVLAKISESGAGVVAAFNPATEKVTLSAKLAGSAPIAVGSDTSGFLAAVKLDGTAQRNNGHSTLYEPLSGHSIFAGVRAGTLTINGQAVSINPASDSIAALVSRIDALDRVHASLDSSTGQIQLAAEGEGVDLDLADTSGLLAALNLPAGRISSAASSLKLVEVDSGRSAVVDAKSVAEKLASALSDLGAAANDVARARDAQPQFQSAVLTALRNAWYSMVGTQSLGLSLSEDATLSIEADASQLAAALNRDPNALADLLTGPHNLLEGLDGVIKVLNDSEVSTSAEPDSFAASNKSQANPGLAFRQPRVDAAQIRRGGSLALLNSLPDSASLGQFSGGYGLSSLAASINNHSARSAYSISRMLKAYTR